ncbi:MAG TPA: MFS transporter, partial [Corynebacterium sp.]|nr:MFS transporter [Corynebacterium sp.]
AQMIGRFTGDLFINRYGRVLVARVGGIFIAAGGALVVLATAPASLYFGLALVGFGCATLVPSAYAAAARLPEMRPSDGVTAVSWLMRLSFLTASPLIGAVAGWVDLRVALGVLILAGARRRSAPQHCAPGNRDW